MTTVAAISLWQERN